MDTNSNSNGPLNPHVIRFYSKKETEYFEIGGKRITRPSLTVSIPSCTTSRSPLVIKGDNLKPLPGMSKMITVQFIQESTKEMINITNPLDINMCCDKCLTVIVPEVSQNTVYHVRIGFNCKKIEKAILSDKNNLKLDSFLDHHQQAQQSHGQSPIISIDRDLDILHHHHIDQAQHQNQINVHNHHQSLENEEISPETETLVHISEDSMQIDPKHIEENNNSNSNNSNITDVDNSNSNNSNIQQPDIGMEGNQHNDEEITNPEINSFIFESDEHILWSNEIVVAVDVGSGRATPPTSVLGKRNASNMTNGSTISNSRKKKSKTTRNSSGGIFNTNGSNGTNIILTTDQIQLLMNSDFDMIKSTLEVRGGDGRIYYDLERRDEDGFTPLHYSCAYGMNGLVEYLLKSDVDPNRADKEGWTPLHWSVKANNLVAIHLLLAYGADQSVPNNSNQYPVEMAFDKGFTLIAATLQGISEQEYKKSHEPLVLVRDNTHNSNFQNLIDNPSNQNNQNSTNNNSNSSSNSNITVLSNHNGNHANNPNNNNNNNNNSNNNSDDEELYEINPNAGNPNELKLLSKHGFEPFVPPNNSSIKSGIIEKHNTLKFIQSAEKLGLTSQHRTYLMDGFKSLRTLRYRLFWIMLTKPIFSRICEWDSNGVDFLVHNKDTLLAVLGLYFGLRGSNSAVDWMSHLARRKCNKSSGGSGDIWTNLRASTFNLQTNLDELKDITSEKGEKRKPTNNSKSEQASIPISLSQSIEEMSQTSSMDIASEISALNSNSIKDHQSQQSGLLVQNISSPIILSSNHHQNNNNHQPDLLLVSNEHDPQISLTEHTVVEEITQHHHHHHQDSNEHLHHHHHHHHHHEHHVHLEEQHHSNLNNQNQEIEEELDV